MACLHITLQVAAENRVAAAGAYNKYKAPFPGKFRGARSKELLVRDEDVQVRHGFDSVANARACLESALFTGDVAAGLKPLLAATPGIPICEVAGTSMIEIDAPAAA